jgi:hypothetical protein
MSEPCKYGDPFCPCEDGDQCHYEGENPMTPSKVPLDEYRKPGDWQWRITKE